MNKVALHPKSKAGPRRPCECSLILQPSEVVMDVDWLITVVQSWACIALALYVFSFVDPNRR